MRYSLLGVALMMTLLSACRGQQQKPQGNNMAPPSSGTESNGAHHDQHPEQPNPNEGSSGE